MIKVNQTDGEETRTLLELGGTPVRSRSVRLLLATALSEPVSRRLRVRASAKALDVYVALRGPAHRLVGAFDGVSYMGGLAARDGRSIALLAGWPTVSRMLVYGETSAADELEAVVEEWVERGRPDTSELDLTVSFRNGNSSIRTRWRGR